MTAVQELKYLFDDILKDRGVSINWDTYLTQEKQQIIDALNKYSDETIDDILFEQYYNETYGSKRSDDQVPDVRKMVENNILNEYVYHNLCDRAMCPNKDVCVNCQSTSSQTEISDFEIDDAWQEFRIQNPNSVGVFQDQYLSFCFAIKWYREQLKKKQ